MYSKRKVTEQVSLSESPKSSLPGNVPSSSQSGTIWSIVLGVYKARRYQPADNDPMNLWLGSRERNGWTIPRSVLFVRVTRQCCMSGFRAHEGLG